MEVTGPVAGSERLRNNFIETGNRMTTIRSNIFRLVTGLALTILPAGFGLAEESLRRPNVVLIISDDQKYTDFGFMGNAHVQTPHLDRLAAQSARYVNGYVPSSVCRPSLVTLLMVFERRF